ncbi:hypothetical protein CXB51_013999 [Gossypium anomalum]|uniref:Reverse transcriptase Ty1/copia-type domain-containing protein n=1 Tax=Gossypium anomalum TaxID=47600 RepID=A0A8J6D4E3_9ROSI|nr:hypothetical protein CXB51_013999 [Gossypium anomalum]
MAFLVLYVDNILLIESDVGELSLVKKWLIQQFSMNDLGKASYILGIQIPRDRKNKMIALSQVLYIDKTIEGRELMSKVPYASAVGSLMYAMLCTRPDIFFIVGMVSRYQANPDLKYWQSIQHILKYFKRTGDNMIMYSRENLTPTGYTDSYFQTCKDLRKSTSGNVFVLCDGSIVCRSVKQQTCTAGCTIETRYMATSEAMKEAIWLSIS